MDSRDLARRLTASGWAFTDAHIGMGVVEAGVSGMTGARGVLVRSTRDGLAVRWSGEPLEPGTWLETSITHGTVPDLDHPATAGVLLAELRASVPGWTVEVLMLRAHVEVCVGSPNSGGRTVHVGPTLGRAVAEALVVVRGGA